MHIFTKKKLNFKLVTVTSSQFRNSNFYSTQLTDKAHSDQCLENAKLISYFLFAYMPYLANED